MVPVIRDAGRLRFDEFLDAYNALVDKARTNTLTADDLTGGNITSPIRAASGPSPRCRG